MKFLFKRRPVSGHPEKPGLFNVLVMQRIDHYQRKAAEWLQQKSENLSIKAKWVLLFLFCILMFSVLAFLIEGKFLKIKTEQSIFISRIKTPVRPEAMLSPKGCISKREYEKIVAFRICMDSLARSPGANSKYEQIKLKHPGLVDSIRVIEIMYQSQFKNQ